MAKSSILLILYFLLLASSGNNNIGIGFGPILKVEAQIQCEPIRSSFCASMAYKSTRMPNFFLDSNQIEASGRAAQLLDLVTSGCSQHVHIYLCELLFPVCMEDGQDAMKKFEIYPCRSYCRQVKTDCEQVILQLVDKFRLAGFDNFQMLSQSFNCSLLPFEANGGNGPLRGPCHDIPEVAANPTIKLVKQPPTTNNNNNINNNSMYHPYTSEVPPFMVDSSSIYENVIGLEFPLSTQQQQAQNNLRPRPTLPANKTNPQQHQNQHNQQQQLTYWSRFVDHVQNLHKTFSIYEILSIITIICLILALNAKRIYRFKSYFSLSSTGSSSNNSSQSSYQNQLKNHRKSTKSLLSTASSAYPPLGGKQPPSVSPSSSSRSLVLIAPGTNNQVAGHKLIGSKDKYPPIDANESGPQSLIHALSRKTPIMFNEIRNNATLDGTNQRHKRPYDQHPAARSIFADHFAARKQHHQSSLDKQQFFNTIDSNNSSNFSSNHYDYIRDSDDQVNQHQLYSNILLSSPSHQILLLDNPIHYGDFQAQRQSMTSTNFRPKPTSRDMSHKQQQQQQINVDPMAYAAPDFSDNGQSFLSRSFQRSQQRSSKRNANDHMSMANQPSRHRYQFSGSNAAANTAHNPYSSHSSSLAGDTSNDMSPPGAPLSPSDNLLIASSSGGSNSTRPQLRRG